MIFISPLSVLGCPSPVEPSSSCVTHNWRSLWQAVPDLFPHEMCQHFAISAKTAGPGSLVLTAETWAKPQSSGGTWSFSLAERSSFGLPGFFIGKVEAFFRSRRIKSWYIKKPLPRRELVVIFPATDLVFQRQLRQDV